MLRKRQTMWLTTLSLTISGFLVLGLLAAGPKGGGTPPPPVGTIFFKYNTNTDYSMKADGSQKTQLGDNVGAPSFNDYGGYRWFIRSEVVGDGQFYQLPEGSTADPQPHTELFAFALDSSGNQVGERIQLTDLFPDAQAGGYLRWSNRTDAFTSFLMVNYEYDAEGNRTSLYYSYDRLEISAQDLEAVEPLTPATLDDVRLWSVVPFIPNPDINEYINTSWSPDGTALVFCSDDRIALLDASTGDVRVLCNTAIDSRIGSCDWAPSGDSILVADTPAGKAQGLYTLDASAASPAPTPVLVSKGTRYGFAVWSPDAAYICASRIKSSGANDVVRINADGSGVISLWSGLSTSGGSHYPYAWSTDVPLP